MDSAQLHSHMFKPPENPSEPMEFLSRSWSLSALHASKAVAPPPPHNENGGAGIILEDMPAELDSAAAVSGNPFSFASSETSLLVLERIMSRSQDVSAGRQSHSGGSVSDSPPVSPSEIEDLKHCRLNDPIKTSVASGTSVTGRRTVGRWLKDRKEKKKEEVRAQNAQLHAAISVAGVAAAIAAIAAATAAKDEQMARTDMAVASAATLVAAQCVEAAEAMGAERELLASVVSSAVSIRKPGDITTLTAAAATALRGAATLKARALKEVWNIASVVSNGGELVAEENFLGACSRELLARGGELLKRTRRGDLHWKVVSVYINRMGQVMLKMKSRHVAGTVTKKKKNVVLEVMKDIPAWPGRHLLEGGGDRRHFALKTVSRGVVEFECRSQREYGLWTQGVTRLLSIAADKN